MTHRIAYLLKKFPRLSETFVLGEILRQENLGQDLHVFSRRAPDDEPRHPELARLRATVERVPSQHALDPWKELFVEPGPGARATFDELQQVAREFGRYENLRLGRVLAEALYLRRRTEELGIDHLHAHFATESAIVAMLVHELGGPTYSVTAHAKDIYRSTVDQSLLDRLVGSSQFTVTVCDANVRFLEERLSDLAMSRVRRLYNGIDLTDFTPPKQARDENHVLAIGRLVEKKGFDILLDALDLLRERGVCPQLTLVGQGPEQEHLEARIERLGLQDQVTFAGGMDQDGVRRLLARATIFALPCIIGADGNRDALPTVLLEALACGLPIVSTPVTGIPEIVGEEGILVPERDALATANAMQKLLGDAELRARFAAGGRERAERLFDGAEAAQTLNTWLNESPAYVG